MMIYFVMVFYNYICAFGIEQVLVIMRFIQNFYVSDFVQISTMIAILINTGGL